MLERWLCGDAPAPSPSPAPFPSPSPPPRQVPALHRLHIKAPPPAHPPSLFASCGTAAERSFSPQHFGAAGRRSEAPAMATMVVVEMDSEASCSIPNLTSLSPSLSHRFLDRKFYLLVVIGELVTEEHLRRAIANIERGETAGSGADAGSARAPTQQTPSPQRAGSRFLPLPRGASRGADQVRPAGWGCLDALAYDRSDTCRAQTRKLRSLGLWFLLFIARGTLRPICAHAPPRPTGLGTPPSGASARKPPAAVSD